MLPKYQDNLKVSCICSSSSDPVYNHRMFITKIRACKLTESRCLITIHPFYYPKIHFLPLNVALHNLYLPTYPLRSLWNIRGGTDFQCVLSFAAFSAVIQSFHPSFILSCSAILLHVSLGLPLFLFPSGAQVSTVLILSYFYLLRICPMYFHLISLILSSILLISVFLCSSLLLICMVFGY